MSNVPVRFVPAGIVTLSGTRHDRRHRCWRASPVYRSAAPRRENGAAQRQSPWRGADPQPDLLNRDGANRQRRVSTAFSENGIVAVIVATIGDAVSVVATVKICDDSPAGIVVRRHDGRGVAARERDSETARSGAERVTVLITRDPATIDADDSDGSFCSVRRPTVRLAVLVASVYVAVITATPVTEVAAVWTSNVPEVDPEAIVMDAGTVASEGVAARQRDDCLGRRRSGQCDRTRYGVSTSNRC